MKKNAPPVGVIPKAVWIAQQQALRADALLEAIERYRKDSRTVPVEWLDELRELVA